MIRRSPTRLELKIEDLTDFDYIQKFDKKKSPTGGPGSIGGISAADAQKFIRQDRIGFRPILTGSTSDSGGNGSFYPSGGGNTAGAAGTADAGETSASTLEGQGGEATASTGPVAASRSASNVADIMDISGDDTEAAHSNIAGERNVSGVDMSLDESL